MPADVALAECPRLSQPDYDRGVPRWLDRLATAFDKYADAAAPSAVALASIHRELEPAIGGFLGLLEPLLLSARGTLARRLARLETCKREPGLAERLANILYPNLSAKLLHLVSRALVQELHASRRRGQLSGDTPQERFVSFTERLRDRRFALELLSRYPLLAEKSVAVIDQWIAFSKEFVGHLEADGSVLAEQFGIDARVDRLTKADGGASDRHRGGRTVLLLSFQGGERLVYKPKSLAAEHHFQQFVVWLNQRGASPRLRPLHVVDCTDHGWVEFIEQRPCSQPGELARFYQRQGAYLALAYLLSATDLHYENLIALGEHPMLIDIEALFHQHLPGPPKDAVSQGFSDSVAATRMLPQLHYPDGVDGPIDFSALGTPDGQPVPYLAPCWQAAGTDEMRLAMLRIPMQQGKHRPLLSGGDRHAGASEAPDIQSPLIDGFTRMYRLLCRHREELLSAEGPVARFARDGVRFIPRPTQSYAILLDHSLHPARLTDDGHQRELFGRMNMLTERFPCLDRLRVTELSDLGNQDVPLFLSRPCSRHLWTSRGGCIRNFFPEPAMNAVRRRIRQLGPNDLARQLWLIRTSLALAISTRGSDNGSRRGTQNCIGGDPRAVARRLIEIMWRRGHEVGWLGLAERAHGWSMGKIGCDLADGLTGIALFFAHLAQVGRRTSYKHLAVAIVETVVERLRCDAEAREALEKSGQVATTIRALVHLGRLWNDARVAAYADDLSVLFDQASRAASSNGRLLPYASPAESLEEAYRLLMVAQSRARLMALPHGVELPGLRGGLAAQGLLLIFAHGANTGMGNFWTLFAGSRQSPRSIGPRRT